MSLLQRPLVTEKASKLNETGTYGFFVNNGANKVEIKKEVERTYGVTVQSVNTIRYAGKKKTRYTKSGVTKGQQPAYKKALVTLKEGEYIDLYGNI